MRIDEAGHDPFAASIHDRRARGDRHGVGGADGADAAVRDQDHAIRGDGPSRVALRMNDATADNGYRRRGFDGGRLTHDAAHSDQTRRQAEVAKVSLRVHWPHHHGIDGSTSIESVRRPSPYRNIQLGHAPLTLRVATCG